MITEFEIYEKEKTDLGTVFLFRFKLKGHPADFYSLYEIVSYNSIYISEFFTKEIKGRSIPLPWDIRKNLVSIILQEKRHRLRHLLNPFGIKY